jgi:hypothetical protein
LIEQKTTEDRKVLGGEEHFILESDKQVEALRWRHRNSFNGQEGFDG